MKVAPILRLLAAPEAPLRFRLVHTGQHYDAGLSGVFFSQLAIPEPDAHLNVGSASHAVQTARVMCAFEEYLLKLPKQPRGVVVVGDVNSTVACALVAVKLEIPVAHVEAGLRSFDRQMPEEINRVVTDAVSDVLLVSEADGMENLRREGVASSRIRFVGNVMIDSLIPELERAKALVMPTRLGMRSHYALVTLHRPSNVDTVERLTEIVELLMRLAPRMTIAFPVHPRTRERMERFGLMGRLAETPEIRVMEPLGYRENLGMMASALVVLTDSGGIQEETSFLGVPCLTIRPNTERPITINQGTNTLIDGALSKVDDLIGDILSGTYKRGGPIPGWDGHAADRIVSELTHSWA